MNNEVADVFDNIVWKRIRANPTIGMLWRILLILYLNLLLKLDALSFLTILILTSPLDMNIIANIITITRDVHPKAPECIRISSNSIPIRTNG